MLIVAGAVMLGVLIGLLLGGSIATLADARFRWWPLAIVGLSLQLIEVPPLKGQVDHWLALGFLIASYVSLLVFVGVNLRRPGFAVVAVGFMLNLLVISINGGMPVEAQALRAAAGTGYPVALRRLVQTGGTKHHLARPSDSLLGLADVIAVGRPVRNVFSVGDLTAMAGVVWVLAAATKGGPGRHRRGRADRRRGSTVGGETNETPPVDAMRTDDEEVLPEPPDELAEHPPPPKPTPALEPAERLPAEQPSDPEAIRSGQSRAVAPFQPEISFDRSRPGS